MIAFAIVATVPSGAPILEIRDRLVQAAYAAGCLSPRVAMFSDFPDLRIEVDCRPEEEGSL